MNVLPCLCKCSFYEFLYVQGNFQWKMVKKFILFRNEKLLITRFYLEELEGVFCPKKGLTSHSTMHKQLMGEKKWNARLHFNLTSFVFILCFHFVLLSKVQMKWQSLAMEIFLEMCSYCCTYKHAFYASSLNMLPWFSIYFHVRSRILLYGSFVFAFYVELQRHKSIVTTRHWQRRSLVIISIVRFLMDDAASQCLT